MFQSISAPTSQSYLHKYEITQNSFQYLILNNGLPISPNQYYVFIQSKTTLNVCYLMPSGAHERRTHYLVNAGVVCFSNIQYSNAAAAAIGQDPQVRAQIVQRVHLLAEKQLLRTTMNVMSTLQR